jgi:hypothetical protein
MPTVASLPAGATCILSSAPPCAQVAGSWVRWWTSRLGGLTTSIINTAWEPSVAWLISACHHSYAAQTPSKLYQACASWKSLLRLANLRQEFELILRERKLAA